MAETTHGCPPIGDHVTPCCGKSPFDLPRTDRLTRDADAVTCGKPAPPEETLIASGGWERNAITFQVPEDYAIAFGHLNPTRAQVAQARAEIEPRHAHQVEAWTQTQAFLAQVEATEFPALAGDLLELHARSEHNECDHCDGGNGGGDWPCSTARLALAHVGIEVPDDLTWDEPVLPVNDGTNPFWPLPMGPLRIADLFPFVTIDSDPITYGGTT